MPGLETEFTDKNISPWGGLRFVEELYRKTGLRNFLEEIQTELPQPQSNRGYNPIDLMEGFIVGVILGANRLAHTGALRNDQVIKRIFGWNKGMASQSTFSRFFSKFDRERNDKVFTQINHYWFSRLKINHITLDFDSTVITRYGSQEGVAKGYNPTKKGRGSHHPLLAMVAETQMIANAWMRTGDSSSGTDFLEFYEETKQIVKPERIGLVRADKGFCSEKIMAQWEKDKLSFIMPVAMTSPIYDGYSNWMHGCPLIKGTGRASFNTRLWDGVKVEGL